MHRRSPGMRPPPLALLWGPVLPHPSPGGLNLPVSLSFPRDSLLWAVSCVGPGPGTMGPTRLSQGEARRTDAVPAGQGVPPVLSPGRKPGLAGCDYGLEPCN